MESDAAWKGLHPVSVLVNLVPRAWRFVRSAWPLGVAVIFGGRGAGFAASVLDLWLLTVFMAVTVGSVLLHFLTLRYRVDAGRLEIRTGLFYRQVRIIPPERIQNVERVKNLFHRASGLVEVRIETASGGDVEGLLSALSEEDASALVDELNALRKRVPAETTGSAPPVLAENGALDLFQYGITGARVGTVAVVVALGAEVASYVDPERVQGVTDVLGGVGAAALLVGIVCGAWLMGPVLALVSHFGYRILKTDGVLVSEEGLFTRRRVELRLDKVQLVTVHEPWLRRLLGFGSVYVETAGVRVDAGGTQQAEAMVPVVDSDALYDLVRQALPGVTLDIEAAKWRKPHPNALWHTALVRLARSAALAVLLTVLAWPYGLVAVLLLPVTAVLVWLDYAFQGWLVSEDAVVSRFGWWKRYTSIIRRSKVQSSIAAQGPVMRGFGLGRVGLRVAGSIVVLPDLAWDEAVRLQRELGPSR